MRANPGILKSDIAPGLMLVEGSENNFSQAVNGGLGTRM